MSEKPAMNKRPQKRAVNIPGRVVTWYFSLRLLNKIALWTLVASVPLGFLAVKVARPIYRDWRQQNALALADAYTAKGDLRGASLAYRQAIRINHKNPEVWKKLVKFLEDRKSNEAVWVWERLVLIQPEVVEHHYGLAESALRNGEVERAGAALQAMNESERTSARYLALSAAVLSAAGKPGDAEKQLEAALAVSPNDDKIAFQLEKLRMGMSGDKRELAQRQLRERAAQDGPSTTEALRELTRSAAVERDFQSASLYATRLKARPDATSQDRLLFLDMEFAANSFALPVALASAQEYALAQPGELSLLANYLIQRKLTEQMLAWLETQSPETLEKPEVKQVLLDLSVASGNWERTLEILRGGSFMPPQIVKKVAMAHDALKASDPNALQLWSEALLAAKGNVGALGIMERLSFVWDWDEARGNTLWAISAEMPLNALVWRALLARELPRKQTPTLANIISGLVASEPRNRPASNEWLRLQFLLKRGDPRKLLETAEANYKAMPENPEFQATYALFLAINGRSDEVNSIVGKMGDDQRREPRKAAYIAYALAKSGRSEQVEAVLSAANPDRREMLPEEVVLMDRAATIAAGGTDDNKLEPVETQDAEVLAELRKVRESDKDDSTSGELYEMLKQQQQEQSGSGQQIEKLRREINADGLPADTPAP